MSEREVEPIIDKLREAEAMVLAIINDDTRRESWRAADECKVLIWKAMDAAGDMARLAPCPGCGSPSPTGCACG